MRYDGTHTDDTMKPVIRLTWRINLGIGALLVVAYNIIIAVANTPNPRWEFIGILLGGVINVVLGVIFFAVDMRRRALLERLMADGIPYDAEIVNVVSPRITQRGIFTVRTGAAFIRVGPWTDTYVECRYTDGNGRVQHIRSNRFLYNTFYRPALRATVYVDLQNPWVRAVAVRVVDN